MVGKACQAKPSSVPSALMSSIQRRTALTPGPSNAVVLELEQGLLASQAHKAKLIVSKSGDIVSFEDFIAQMAAEAAAR